MLWDIIGVNYYVKKRSKENNWRTVGAVEDAGICAQPASLEVYHRREAASREGLSLCWLLCNEGPV
jgi:hypothetical protein